MQLRAVVIYHSDGKRMHEVQLATGSLNVIPGVSDTGKSSLLEIVDYCLGSGDHRISKEDQLDSIHWYGLRLEIDGKPVFVARERPAFEKNVSEQAMLRIGAPSAPRPDEIRKNTNISTVIRELSAMIGIGENDQPSIGSSSETSSVSATLRHAVPYVFQPQELIASPRYLFAGQDEDKALHIRDTLPYFLGSVDEDAIRQRRKLRRRQADLRAANKRLAEFETPGRELARRVGLLVEDARSAGLIGPATSNDEQDGRPVLENAMVVSTADPGLATGGEAASLGDLHQRREELSEVLRAARISRRTLTDRRRLAESYDHEAQEQRFRLTSINVFASDGDEDACPLCGAHDGEPTTTVTELREELERASARAEESATAPPQLEAAIEKFDAEIVDTQQRLSEVDRELALVLKRSRTQREARGRAEEQAFVRGRIAGFLDEHPAPKPGELDDLKESIEVIEAEVVELEAGLSSEATRSRTDIALSFVGEDMTTMAQRLGLSYADKGVRLDPFNLTVVGRDRRGPVRLDRRDIGSGKSWVGYHVVTLLALQRYFADEGRPVPRMLLLDQPTQAFYPSEKAKQADRNLDDMNDQDQEQVHKIFELLRDTVKELDGSLQVIVLDHAEIPEPWFEDAVGDNNWRNGDALVPADWYADTA